MAHGTINCSDFDGDPDYLSWILDHFPASLSLADRA